VPKLGAVMADKSELIWFGIVSIGMRENPEGSAGFFTGTGYNVYLGNYF
jgi:hypothetical protein